MAKLHLCSIYRNRPECCRNYPWNEANEIFEDCQFYDPATKSLISLEELRKTKTQETIERFCVECGKCCWYWENGKPVVKCSALQIIDESELTAKIKAAGNNI